MPISKMPSPWPRHYFFITKCPLQNACFFFFWQTVTVILLGACASMNIILKKCNIQSSHQPRHGFGNRDVHCLALGHINGCKMKKKIKNNNLFALLSRDVIFDNFHMVESCHGHWWPRTIAMSINYRSGQLLMQETTFRVESVAIGSSNHTHGKLAKKTTFCDIHHFAVHISTCCDIM